MRKKGFTMVEMLLTVCLLAFLIFVIIQLFSFASKYYNFGTFKLRQLSMLRIALELLKSDIREASGDLRIINGNKTLLIRKFTSDSTGQLRYDKSGTPESGELCEYRFSSSSDKSASGILYRNNRAILTDIDNVDFAFNKEQIDDAQLLRVIVTIEHQHKGGRSKTSIHISPKHLSSWARDPFWVSIGNDQRFKYKF
ncbi:MAG: hypothetical protein KKB51_05145 [Candidatus Riflebacteria bacterium]|nr:hypothetical protein [Candidatus Riflebacteria bacterium]